MLREFDHGCGRSARRTFDQMQQVRAFESTAENVCITGGGDVDIAKSCRMLFF